MHNINWRENVKYKKHQQQTTTKSLNFMQKE